MATPLEREVARQRKAEHGLVSVEFEIGLGVEVNVETGEVTAVVCWPDDVTAMTALQYWDRERGDYLDPNDARAKLADEIAGRVEIRVGDLNVPFTLKPKAVS
jgi:hypothetical protein